MEQTKYSTIEKIVNLADKNPLGALALADNLDGDYNRQPFYVSIALGVAEKMREGRWKLFNGRARNALRTVYENLAQRCEYLNPVRA
tara:strand:- start:180 stop:440 length:261 start_codon:yes stop_codon:yes gene_type:complete